jgi:hypothetical protein
MNLNTIQMTAITPSSFGMPICGHAFETSFAGSTTQGAAMSVVRDRRAATKGDMGIALAYVPGTSAWRPPPS